MSTSILPDDSVVVRLPAQTIHIDAQTRAIHIRANSTRDELGGSILTSYPLSAVSRIRIQRAGSRFQLTLELISHQCIELGLASSQEISMVTARAIADVARCRIQVSQGTVLSLPGPSKQFTEETDTFDEEPEERVLIVTDDPHELPTTRIPIYHQEEESPILVDTSDLVLDSNEDTEAILPAKSTSSDTQPDLLNAPA